MKTRRFVLFVLVAVAAFPTSGSFATRPRPVPGQPPAAAKPERPDLRELRSRGNALFRAGQYLAAGGIYEDGYQRAISLGEKRSALRFLNNLGSSRFKLFRYRCNFLLYFYCFLLLSSLGITFPSFVFVMI